MGATRIPTHQKAQVSFTYLIADTYVSVVANLYPEIPAQIIEHKPVESDTPGRCEIVSAAYTDPRNGKLVCWDDIPAFIEADIEREAWEVFRKKYNA